MTRLKATLTLGMFVFALLAPLLLAATPAKAQSEADLRKQNQELQSKVKDLEAELAAAKTRSDALQKRIDSLEAALAARAAAPQGSSAAAPPPEEKVTIDESKPAASPRALFNAVVESYRKAVADSPIGKKGDRDRAAYMRKLDKWKGLAEREFRLPIEWHVLLQPPRMGDPMRERIATFIAVDPVTGTHLGHAFDVELNRQLAGRLAALDSGEDMGLLQLKGAAVTRLRINEKRDAKGTFDSPRFVGPFAEYDFTVEPSSIIAVKPAAATQPATTQPAKTPTTN